MSFGAVQCDRCGGAVKLAPAATMPRCVFCGSDASHLVALPVAPKDVPDEAIPFATTREEAAARFKAFCGSSWWYPSDLGRSQVQFEALWVPAWAFRGALETHWTALVGAGTRIGVAPLAGIEQVEFDQILVASSRTLTVAELSALGRYDEAALGPVDAEAPEHPWEVGELPRRIGALAAGHEMERRHRESLRQRYQPNHLKTASVARGLTSKLVLVPVWLGQFQYRGQSWRFLVNGQTGAFVGGAPRSRGKQLAAGGALLIALLAFAAWVGWSMGAAS